MTERFLVRADRRKQQKRLYGSGQWERARRFVLERDNYLCQIKLKACRTKANTVDHIIRPEEGGELFDSTNLRASCRSCNMVRHNAAYFREKADAKAAPEGYTPPWSRPASPLVTPDERPSSRVSVRDSYAVHWHPAGAELHRQQLTGNYSKSEQCPCTELGGSD